MKNKSKKRKRRIKKRQQALLMAQKSSRKVIRHNTAANQEKHRLDWQSLQPDEFGVVADRRIMPRDERERRYRLDALSSDSIGNDESAQIWNELASDSPHSLGIVVEVGQGLCRVSFDETVMICDIRGVLSAEGSGYTNLIAAGDRVLVSQTSKDRGTIERILPRRSGLARPDSFYTHLNRILAANVDQLLVVASWREPQIWLEMIDEYLIGAGRNGLGSVICINKVDLANDISECEEMVAPYGDLGHSLLFTSATTGFGLDQLRDALQDKTTVLTGLSGVGKSSLLSAIDSTLDLRVNTVNQKRQQGRHTTTQAVMYPFSGGGYVIDTPGIRDFGLKGLRRSELVSFYPELEAFMGQCRYNDCSHSHEPGCAVRRAVETGVIAGWRLKNYVNIQQKLDK